MTRRQASRRRSVPRRQVVPKPSGSAKDQPIDPEVLAVLLRVAVALRSAELLERAH